MWCERIGEYLVIGDNNNWCFDCDENGMSYFIHSKYPQYVMSMSPTGEMYNAFTCNDINSDCVCDIQTTLSPDDAQEWLNNFIDNNFMGLTTVPQKIRQYEATRRYVSSLFSDRFIESDQEFLKEAMYKEYGVTNNSYSDYLKSLIENTPIKEEQFDSEIRMTEGFFKAIGNFLAGKSGRGGWLSSLLLKFLPKILSFIPPLAPYIPIIMGGACIAKIAAGIGQCLTSIEYAKASSAKRVGLLSLAIMSQLGQCIVATQSIQGFLKKLSDGIAKLVEKIPLTGDYKTVSKLSQEVDPNNVIMDNGVVKKLMSFFKKTPAPTNEALGTFIDENGLNLGGTATQKGKYIKSVYKILSNGSEPLNTQGVAV